MSDLKSSLKNRIQIWFIYVSIGIFLLLVGVLCAPVISWARADFVQGRLLQAQNLSRFGNRFIHLDTQTSRYILKSAIPFLESTAGEDDPFTLFELNWSQIYWRLAANVREANPQEILKSQLPLFALIKPQPIKITPKIVKTEPVQDLTPSKSPEPTNAPQDVPKLANDPVVLIYHTHTSESYIPVSGKDHVYPKGDIVEVGSYLKQILEEKYGIKCVHADEIHDQIPFRLSYQRSQLTVIKYLKEYPSLKVVLDIHRDATPGVSAKCVIKGVETATIGIIVGTDAMGLSHPNWRKNYHFASKLGDAMNLYYPGLNSRVLKSEARYNQHLHDHALIIEFGDQYSELDDIHRAVEDFAEILALTLNGDVSADTETSTPSPTPDIKMDPKK